MIPLPILNAYVLLAKLGYERVEFSGSQYGDAIHGFATRARSGAQVLVYHFNPQDEQSSGASTDVELTVHNLLSFTPRRSSLPLKHYRIDAQHGNVSGALQGMGQPNAEQVKAIVAQAQLPLLEPPSQVKVENAMARIRFTLPAKAVSLIVLGEEAKQAFKPTAHIALVLQHEAAFKAAKQRASASALEQLVKECSAVSQPFHCFWGQKALFALAELGEQAGKAAAADSARQRLLQTTLNDTDPLLLLQARLQYLNRGGASLPAQAMQKELRAVRSRLERLARWANWSRM